MIEKYDFFCKSSWPSLLESSLLVETDWVERSIFFSNREELIEESIDPNFIKNLFNRLMYQPRSLVDGSLYISR